jgi:hypothetical protein
MNMTRTLFVTGLVILCGMLFSGCQSGTGSAFGFGGLPKEHYRVGGGFNIKYEAPADGTFYLVDLSSGKFVVTKNVTEADTFEFSIDPTNIDEETRACGVDTRISKLVLYFVPKPEQQ